MVDRLASVTDPFGNTVGYTYDPNGNRNGLIYPGNRRVTYLFDALDRMVSVQDWGGVTTTYTYDTAGRLASQLMGNGSTVTYSYDDSGRLLAKEDKNSSGEVIASYTYTLDPNGNRTGMGMNQPLLPEAPPDNATFTHNDGNQVTSRNGTTYTYDGKGNRATKTEGGVTTQYTYDFNNRLTRVNDGANLWEYLYNSDGKRLSSSANGVETQYLLDLSGALDAVLAETTAVNGGDRYYVHGDGLLYSVDGATGERVFYHYDQSGSTVALTNTVGEVIGSYAYLPFGDLTGVEGVGGSSFTFVGKLGIAREVNGLYFMRARFYDPETGTFLSTDPVAGVLSIPLTLNPYAYALGNPSRFVDPSGKVPLAVGLFNAWEAVDRSSSILEFGASFRETYEKEGEIGLRRNSERLGLSLTPILGQAQSLFEGFTGNDIYGRSQECSDVDVFCHGGRAARRWVNRKVEEEVVEALAVLGSMTVEVPSHRVDLSSFSESSPVVAPSRTTHLNSGGLIAGLERLKAQIAAAKGQSSAARPPRQYLAVAGYARGEFNREYRHILAPGFLDNATRSAVEMTVENEIFGLQKARRYGYSGPNSKKRVTERRNADVAGAVGGLYSRLTTALSKHEIMIRDLSALPQGATGGPATSGIYGGGR